MPTPRTALPTFALLAALAALAACAERHDGGPIPEPTRAPPEGFEHLDTAVRPGADAGANEKRAAKANRPRAAALGRGFSKEELQDIRRALPRLGRAEELSPLQGLPQTRLARIQYCLETDDVAAVARRLRSQLGAAGWTDVVIHGSRRAGDRRTITAHTDRHRVTATLERVTIEGCDGERDLRVLLSVQERPPAATAGGRSPPRTR